VLDQAARNFIEVKEAHIDHERGRRVGKARPVEIEGLVRLAMTGDVTHAGRKPAMGEGDARRRRTALRRRNAGHHLERDPGARKLGGFLTAASENEWIAALETNDTTAAARRAHQHFVDLVLRNRMAARLLADTDTRRANRN